MSPLEFLQTWTPIAYNIGGTLIPIVLAVVSIIGLNTWRTQMIGQSRYEAARQLLLLARKFRAAFGRSRGPFSSSSEAADRLRGENETDGQSRILDEQYVRLRRLQPCYDLFPELEQATFEAEIVTDEKLVELVSSYYEVARELNIAIIQTFHAQFLIVDKPHASDLYEMAKKMDRTELIYQAGEDELTRKVDATMDGLEAKLRKYMRR